MKQTVRAFSIGLMVAGIILLGVYYFNGDVSGEQAELSTEELIAQIEQKGYRVITEQEYISFSVKNGQNNDEQQTEENETKDYTESEENPETEEVDETAEESEDVEEEEQEEERTNDPVVITVESGMASSQISDMLEAEGIIEDAQAFNRYLLEHDYSLRIQLGDHELERGMSHYEIAERLTN